MKIDLQFFERFEAALGLLLDLPPLQLTTRSTLSSAPYPDLLFTR
jgi:hypothetical protein